jgi:hypothetical protein
VDVIVKQVVDSLGEPVEREGIATIIAQVSVDGVAAKRFDVLGVYVDGELRGKEKVRNVGGKSLVELKVFSKKEVEGVRFNLFQRSSGLVLEQTLARAEIELGKVIGSVDDPFMIDIITLRDITPPKLEFVGGAEVIFGIGSVYEELGAVAMDVWDGDISASVVVEGEVDTGKVGEYEVKYNVSDAAGNKAQELVRKIIVEPFGEPVELDEFARILGHVFVNGVPAEEGDIIGIYVGGELRGKQKVQYFSDNAWLGNARVGSSGDEELATRAFPNHALSLKY